MGSEPFTLSLRKMRKAMDCLASTGRSRWMPRKPRFFLSDIPVHIVQRGHSREPSEMATIGPTGTGLQKRRSALIVRSMLTRIKGVGALYVIARRLQTGKQVSFALRSAKVISRLSRNHYFGGEPSGTPALRSPATRCSMWLSGKFQKRISSRAISRVKPG